MLEKTVLQQLQEIFPMEVNREQADTGEKIRLRNDEQKVEIDFLLDGQLEQGYGYKNSEAYNRDVYEASYISEYGYQAYEEQIKEAMKHYYNNEITLEELAESVKEAENDNGYSHKDFLVLTNYQEEISSHLFDAVDWQYPDTLFNEWIDSDEINLVGNKYIFTAGMELNDFLKMEYLKDFQQGNVNILEVDGKQYISLQDLVNIDIDRYSDRCLKVYYENEKRESKTQEKIMQFQSNLEFVNKKYKNADVVLIVWATEMCREQGLADYCPTQLKIFDSDIVYDVIKDLKQFDIELTGDQIFEDCCLECNALLNKDLQQLKEDFSYTDMEELSEYEKETVKEFLDAYNGNYNLIDYECNGNASSIWIRKDLTSNEIEVCRIIDKHFDVFKNLEDRVDIDLFNIRKEEISTERNEIEEDLDEIEM